MLQALTNVVNESRPTFELYINNDRVTNDSVISLPKDRTLFLFIKNVSDFTADQLRADFFAPASIDPTNVMASGWTFQPLPVTLGTADKLNLLGVAGHSWEWEANHGIASGKSYACASLQIATNVSESFHVEFRIYANRSRLQTFAVKLTF